MALYEVDPLGEVYTQYEHILNNITIKYVGKEQEYETLESKQTSDIYIRVVKGEDNLLSYVADLTDTDYSYANVSEEVKIAINKYADISGLTDAQKKILLYNKRQEIMLSFEEQNNYYRMLNGYPNLDDKDLLYVSKSLIDKYDLPEDITIFDNSGTIIGGVPIHQIQDYYNKISRLENTPEKIDVNTTDIPDDITVEDTKKGLVNYKGNYYISLIESSGYINELINTYTDSKYEYLKYIGSNRIDIATARGANNFQIIQLKKDGLKFTAIEQFVDTYEKAREYFVKTIYIYNFKNIIDYYDNFIAMCIMIMTFDQILARQIPNGIKRNFFDIQAIKNLYEMYNIPYNMNIDEDTQLAIVHNLNLFIQQKATDKVIYNIADILGLSNLNIYKYYLTKEHDFNEFGVPIFKYKKEWNLNYTNEQDFWKIVPEYERMYNVYFQKANLENNDLNDIFNDKLNRVDYEAVTHNDPLWFEDDVLYNRVWDSAYNFVESKYLSLEISYSMTQMLFDNIVLYKAMFEMKDSEDGIVVNLPRITGDLNIPIFDIFVLLQCLTSAKHDLRGEIIADPSKVVAVLDHTTNEEYPDTEPINTFGFDFDYFLYDGNSFTDYYLYSENDDHIYHGNEGVIEEDGTYSKYVYYVTDNHNTRYALNNDGVFEILDSEPEDFEDSTKTRVIPIFNGLDHINMARDVLTEEEFEEFEEYISILSLDNYYTAEEKITAFNQMYINIKNLYKLLSNALSNSHTLHDYRILKTLYYGAFYSGQTEEMFTIEPDNGVYDSDDTIPKRIAWTYFEYLYFKNRTLYNAIFTVNLREQYLAFLEEVGLTSLDFTYDEYLLASDIGYATINDEEIPIRIDYSELQNSLIDGTNVTDELIYSYVNHIIDRLSMLIKDPDTGESLISYMYIMNDMESPMESLLVKMVKFFKSYTVDLLGLDKLIVMDMKPENLLELFDTIAYIRKLINTKDNLNLSHSDLVARIIETSHLKDLKLLEDKVFLQALLKLEEDSIAMRDNLNSVNKTILYEDNQSLFDTIKILTEIVNKDNLKLTDSVTISEDDSLPIIYGFHYDSTVSDYNDCITYVEYAKDLTPIRLNENNEIDYGSWKNTYIMPKPCMLTYSGKVDYYLDDNDYGLKEDGTESDFFNPDYNGNAMMQWGDGENRLYWKIEPDEDNPKSFTFLVSNISIDGYIDYNFHKASGYPTSHFYTPICNGSIIDGKLRSIGGQQVSNNNTVSTELNAAIANNTTDLTRWYTETYVDRMLINMLTILVTKSVSPYNNLGYGFSTGNNSNILSYRTGQLSQGGLFVGSRDGNSPVKIFGMENYYGFQYRRVAGDGKKDINHYVKLTYNNEDGTDCETYNVSGNGYLIAGVIDNAYGSDKIGYFDVDENMITPRAGDSHEPWYSKCIISNDTSDLSYASYGSAVGDGEFSSPFTVKYEDHLETSTSILLGSSLSYR